MEKRQFEMFITTINNGSKAMDIHLKGTRAIKRAMVYLSGVYGNVVDKESFIDTDYSTTLKFKVDVGNGWIFDSTIKNFQIMLDE